MPVYNQPYVRLLTLLYFCTPSSHRLLLSSPPGVNSPLIKKYGETDQLHAYMHASYILYSFLPHITDNLLSSTCVPYTEPFVTFLFYPYDVNSFPHFSLIYTIFLLSFTALHPLNRIPFRFHLYIHKVLNTE